MQSPLATAAISTFEALGFLLPDERPSAEQLAAPLPRGARVTFAGPAAGAVAVRASDDVAAAVAANMLGVDPAALAARPDRDALVRDALGELANVICGNLLPALGGRAAVFHLGAPEAVAPGDDASRPAAAVTLGVEEGRAEVTLHVDRAR